MVDTIITIILLTVAALAILLTVFRQLDKLHQRDHERQLKEIDRNMGRRR